MHWREVKITRSEDRVARKLRRLEKLQLGTWKHSICEAPKRNKVGNIVRWFFLGGQTLESKLAKQEQSNQAAHSCHGRRLPFLRRVMEAIWHGTASALGRHLIKLTACSASLSFAHLPILCWLILFDKRTKTKDFTEQWNLPWLMTVLQAMPLRIPKLPSEGPSASELRSILLTKAATKDQVKQGADRVPTRP